MSTIRSMVYRALNPDKSIYSALVDLAAVDQLTSTDACPTRRYHAHGKQIALTSPY
jgi:hypothetical protein